jgi:tetratricopeptide (TPR) repeat protein
MPEEGGTRWRRRALVGGALGCLGAAALLQWGEQRPAFVDGGYHRRVAALLETDEVARALAELDASTLLDESALALLESRSSVSSLAHARARDEHLRTLIAKKLLSRSPRESSGGSKGSTQHWELLERATRNATLLVELAPASAEARLLLGLTYLQRGSVSGAPIDYVRSAKHLRQALAIDPKIPRAKDALRVASARAAPR